MAKKIAARKMPVIAQPLAQKNPQVHRKLLQAMTPMTARTTLLRTINRRPSRLTRYLSQLIRQTKSQIPVLKTLTLIPLRNPLPPHRKQHSRLRTHHLTVTLPLPTREVPVVAAMWMSKWRNLPLQWLLQVDAWLFSPFPQSKLTPCFRETKGRG